MIKRAIFIALVITASVFQLSKLSEDVPSQAETLNVVGESEHESSIPNQSETNASQSESHGVTENGAKYAFSEHREELNRLAEDNNWKLTQSSEFQQYVDSRKLIIEFDGTIAPSQVIENLTASFEVKAVKQLAADLPFYVIEFRDDYSEQTSAQLMSMAGVVSIEKDYIASMWGKKSPDSFIFQPGGSKWDSRNRSRRAKQLENTYLAPKICILDSGVNLAHEDLKTANIYGQSFIGGEISDYIVDEHGHGTGVVSILVAQHNNVGIDGLVPQSEVCVAKVFNKFGYGNVSDIISAAAWAVKQSPDIINFSLGFSTNSKLLERILKQASQRHNILLVAAAGNDSQAMVSYPAKYPFVISTGSHSKDLTLSKFSNWGREVDLYAPGENVLVATLDNHNYESVSGTSVASAMLTGVLAQYLSAGRNVSSHEAWVNRYSVAIKADYYLPSINVLRTNGGSNSYITNNKSRNARLISSSDTLSLTYDVSGPKNVVGETEFSLLATVGESIISLDSQIASGSTGQYRLEFNVYASEVIQQLAEDKDNYSVSLYLEANGSKVIGSESEIEITSNQVSTGHISSLSVTPSNLYDKNITRRLQFNFVNAGNQVLSNPKFDVYAVNAVHEGVSKVPRKFIGSIQSNKSVQPEQTITLTLSLQQFEFPESNVTFWIEAFDNGQLLTQFLQGIQYQSVPGQATPLYAQARHIDIAVQAVELLRQQGIYIPDLHDSNVFVGDANSPYEWPEIILPNNYVSTTGYFDSQMLSFMRQSFPGVAFSLVDGAHDADGVDVAFGYKFEDTFDTHFWMDDTFDDDGLDSNGRNHHSALTKMKLLVNGQSAIPGQAGDAILRHGAIEHYDAGHKAGAWWLLGHAIHLIGDLSVPSHVDDNAHGVYGATFHNWADRNAHNYWDASDALNRGGFVDPYQDAAAEEPVRFLAYSLQQIAGAFPWAATLTGYTGRDANRVLGGEGNTYSEFLSPLMASLEPRPTLKWHVNKDEVWDTLFDECQLVDWRGTFEERQDCMDRDGHIDRDNTDDDGSNSDGDMVRIGKSNYTYAIRAAAGLLYYFAVETGQYLTPEQRYIRVMPAINHIILN